jgi:hypothetical protein
MERQIFLDRTAKAKICVDFNVSNVTLWSALTFKTNSSLARMLRKVAIERGGIENSPKNFQTIHNTSERSMTQVFSDRVKLEVFFETGQVVFVVDDQQLSTIENPTMTDFYGLQNNAISLAEKLMASE